MPETHPKRKHVLLTGGTGFIGSSLVTSLVSSGCFVWVLTRQTDRQGPPTTGSPRYIGFLDQIPREQVIDVIINLAGQSLATQRWNPEYKALLISSRVNTTHGLTKWLAEQGRQVDCFINGSAIGYYGDHGDDVLTETSSSRECFSHALCSKWEAASDPASAHCRRLVKLRIGIVLGEEGGPLASMLLPFKLGLGGPIGKGDQYWSWIHLKDLVRLIVFCMDNPSIQGELNATAPNPLRQKQFAASLARSLKRPGFVPMPTWLARLALGEFATEVLMKSQQVLPEKALQNNFTFCYAGIDEAFSDIFAGKA